MVGTVKRTVHLMIQELTNKYRTRCDFKKERKHSIIKILHRVFMEKYNESMMKIFLSVKRTK